MKCPLGYDVKTCLKAVLKDNKIEIEPSGTTYYVNNIPFGNWCFENCILPVLTKKYTVVWKDP